MDVNLSAAEIWLLVRGLRVLSIREVQHIDAFNDACIAAGVKEGFTKRQIEMKMQHMLGTVRNLRKRLQHAYNDATSQEEKQAFMPFFRNMDGKWQRVPGYGCYSEHEAQVIINTMRERDPISEFAAFRPEDIHGGGQ